MGLQFCFGPSGSGKSTYIQNEIISGAMNDPDKKFFLIVPDQYTMHTQKEMVMRHPDRGLLNIDVLSFGRLAHRIFAETGEGSRPVLEDSGKSLLIKALSEELYPDLKVLGPHLKKLGYVHEVKSAISEFMQYGIDPDTLETLINAASGAGKRLLSAKLADVSLIYRKFLDFIKERFITTEEKMDVLARAVYKSELLKGSVIYFDGFTGFTPVQNRVLLSLLHIADKVCVTVVMGAGEDPYIVDGEQRLFCLSKTTVEKLNLMAERNDIERHEDVFLGNEGGAVYKNDPMLRHMEAHLFRQPLKRYIRPDDAPYDISAAGVEIMEAGTPVSEVTQVCRKISMLVREGYYYRDFAIICGNPEEYADHILQAARILDIPFYIDSTAGILLNPLTESIRSALSVLEKDFDRNSVFAYLKSGMSRISGEKVCRLEAYCTAYDIKHFSMWIKPFTKYSRAGYSQEELKEINSTREAFLLELQPLTGMTGGAFHRVVNGRSRKLSETYEASKQVDALRTFLESLDAKNRLEILAEYYRENGNPVKSGEYRQIYGLVMELFGRVERLIGTQELNVGEFREVLEAGFGEIRVGSIPQNVDKILVGDLERTRLTSSVKILFIIGAGDNNIPGSSGNGGLISDVDREFLADVDSDIELSPTPRQKMYTQRLYLYMNMTKPVDRLVVTYPRADNEGKSVRGSYLISAISAMFPELEISRPETDPLEQQIFLPGGGLKYAARGLRMAASGELNPEEMALYTGLVQNYERDEIYSERIEILKKTAAVRYVHKKLPEPVVALLYGNHPHISISRLEQYSMCAYAYFLKYGMGFRNAPESGIDDTDMGNIYHGILEIFSERLTKAGTSWQEIDENTGRIWMEEAVDAFSSIYGENIFSSEYRSSYGITQIKRIMNRTFGTVKYQLKKGKFDIAGSEITFRERLSLDNGKSVVLEGKIDRIDTYRKEKDIFVKIVDYKSGQKDVKPENVEAGISLQLPIYLGAACTHYRGGGVLEGVDESSAEKEAGEESDKKANVIPAAMLYFRIFDPMVDVDAGATEEVVLDSIHRGMKMTGMVNADKDTVFYIDSSISSSSDVIPAGIKKDGSFSSHSHVLSGDDMQGLIDAARDKAAEISEEILDGAKEISPFETSPGKTACQFCSYRGICRFDTGINGFRIRRQ